MTLICDECGQPTDYVDEAGLCDECSEPDPVELQRAYDDYRAGIGRPQHEIDAELRDAGRGHLVSPCWRETAMHAFNRHYHEQEER